MTKYFMVEELSSCFKKLSLIQFIKTLKSELKFFDSADERFIKKRLLNILTKTILFLSVVFCFAFFYYFDFENYV